MESREVEKSDAEEGLASVHGTSRGHASSSVAFVPESPSY